MRSFSIHLKVALYKCLNYRHHRLLSISEAGHDLKVLTRCKKKCPRGNKRIVKEHPVNTGPSTGPLILCESGADLISKQAAEKSNCVKQHEADIGSAQVV